MTNTTHTAALIAAGLVNNKRYLKCVRQGNYSTLDGLGEHSVYALDVEDIVKDAWAIALKIEEAERVNVSWSDGMSNQTKRLTTREKQELIPLVKAAQSHDEQARAQWNAIGELLDKFRSGGHSQCCPIGGNSTGGRSGGSGTMPCPCGWDTPAGTEDVLRRMITFIGQHLSTVPDLEATDLITDGLAALNHVRTSSNH